MFRLRYRGFQLIQKFFDQDRRGFQRALLVFALMGCAAVMQPVAAEPLPAQVLSELAKLKISPDALSVVVYRLDSTRGELSSSGEWVSHNPLTSRNPASLMKLVTTSAAMDLLGPAFTWSTQVFVGGPINDGVLTGNLYIKGQGDPKLGAERLWLLMRRVRGLGIQSIQGDIVLDRLAFENMALDPADFDGEPSRPYNASADALLINFKSLLINFVPDPQAKVVRIHAEPPLSGVKIQATAPLVSGDCLDYRAVLKADLQDPTQISFKGQYPQSCGERLWPVAYADPAHFASKAVEGMWHELGGTSSGQVREGSVPPNLKPAFAVDSAQLAEVIRDINKFSNNVMAQQLFLTLGAQLTNSATPDSARGVLNQWWAKKIGTPTPKFDNGSGLSRETQMSAQDLGKLLGWIYGQSFYPEIAASLPLVGVDGTLKQSRAKTRGHIKTGSLKGVTGIAGYLPNINGQDCVVVAIINHSAANGARPVFDALLDWVGNHK